MVSGVPMIPERTWRGCLKGRGQIHELPEKSAPDPSPGQFRVRGFSQLQTVGEPCITLKFSRSGQPSMKGGAGGNSRHGEKRETEQRKTGIIDAAEPSFFRSYAGCFHGTSSPRRSN